jgi:hypothetical protein
MVRLPREVRANGQTCAIAIMSTSVDYIWNNERKRELNMRSRGGAAVLVLVLEMMVVMCEG